MLQIPVLDKGYVRLENYMGSDLSVVNAARVSYDKASEKFTERDEKLLNFLIREGHTSPFRHAVVTFECYAPLMVKNQWWKYVVGSDHQDKFLAWNESSRRYITEDEEFYIPEAGAWRSKPANSKQGSGANLNSAIGGIWTEALGDAVYSGARQYRQAIEAGIAPEQARLFLPAYALYVRWWWTSSLQGVIHFLNQRLEHDAQWEIQQYAKAVKSLTSVHFPVSMRAVGRDQEEVVKDFSKSIYTADELRKREGYGELT